MTTDVVKMKKKKKRHRREEEKMKTKYSIRGWVLAETSNATTRTESLSNNLPVVVFDISSSNSNDNFR